MKKALMVVGTSSFSGKSLIAAALCRIFRDAGFKVAPFKAQNMSLNSAATKDGKEISRAQAFQAIAAGVEPTSDMNPILLKPRGDGLSQVILNGSPYGDISAEEYYDSFVDSLGLSAVKGAINRLQMNYEIIVMEGAGSPVEINLYERDIANLASAELADAEVVLVADIDRGGVFAAIYGTLGLMLPRHKKKVRGIIINKFRGDIKLLKPGLDMIEDLVGLPVIGVVPYLENIRLPAEDSQSLGEIDHQRAEIAVLRLPKISNFTDFDPLAFDHRIKLRYISSPKELGDPDAIIIPGTKSTIDDLKWIKNTGFDKIKTFSNKIPIIGICGGYQILGRRIFDKGVETPDTSEHEGLGLLDVETSFESYEKKTTPVSGTVLTDKGVFADMKGTSVSGYEIHMGRTILLDDAEPIFRIRDTDEGAASRHSMVFGTYIHGLFDSEPFRERFVNFIVNRSNLKRSVSGKDISEVWEKTIEEIAKTVNAGVDLSWFYED